MAKKKKAIKKEPTQITFTEFDEKEYLVKELRNIKLTLVGSVLGVAIAFVSFALTFVHPVAGAVAGGLGVAAFKPMISTAKIDTSKLEKKNYLGMFASYFFTWIALWVLLLNPPIADVAHPSVNNITPAAQELSENYNDTGIYVTARIVDNAAISSVRFEVFDDAHPEPIAVPEDAMKRSGITYSANIFSIVDGLGALEGIKSGSGTALVNYRIISTDTSGQVTDVEGEITVYPYQPPSIIGIQPASGGIVRNDPIMFTVSENSGILKVYYILDGEEKGPLKYDKTKAPQYLCEISPKKWEKGTHTVVIVIIDMGGNECRSDVLTYTRS